MICRKASMLCGRSWGLSASDWEMAGHESRRIRLPELAVHRLGHARKRHHPVPVSSAGWTTGRIVAQAAMHDRGQRIQVAQGPGSDRHRHRRTARWGVVHFQDRRVLVVAIIDGMARAPRSSSTGARCPAGKGCRAIHRGAGSAAVQHPQRAQHAPQHLAQPGLGGGCAFARVPA